MYMVLKCIMDFYNMSFMICYAYFFNTVGFFFSSIAVSNKMYVVSVMHIDNCNTACWICNFTTPQRLLSEFIFFDTISIILKCIIILFLDNFFFLLLLSCKHVFPTRSFDTLFIIMYF